MIERLARLEKRYQDLETLLASPEVASHPEQYQKYAKEHSSLRGIIAKFREYRKITMEIQDLEEMLKRRDQEPDIACMAESELGEVRN